MLDAFGLGIKRTQLHFEETNSITHSAQRYTLDTCIVLRIEESMIVSHRAHKQSCCSVLSTQQQDFSLQSIWGTLSRPGLIQTKLRHHATTHENA